MIYLLLFGGLLALVMINVPIAVSIGVVAVGGMVLTSGSDAMLNVPLTLYEGATKFPLLAIPLFVLAGELMNTSSISKRLIDLVSAMIGFVRGGLAMVNIGVSMFFAEISGSAVADVAATGSVLMPAMKKRGYKPTFVAAITSSSASLAIIIPPSISMILYGAIADTSIVKLFLAGVVPGVLGGAMMMALSYYFAIRYNLPREEAFSWKNLKQKFKDAIWALFLPVIILGGIFGGIVTATEGAGLAVIAALVIGFVIYRELTLAHLYKCMVRASVQTAAVMLLVATSALLGLFLTEVRLPQQMAQAILNFTESKIVVLMLLNVLFFVLGMFLHGAAAIILVVPMVLPLVLQFGINPIHFGLIVTLNLAIGQQTPPVASVLATACSIAKVDIWSTTRANLPFIGVLIALLLLVTYVPFITLGLVDWVYG
ncbi:putative TRAP-type C4-dicarboxylate transport system, large permease component [Vibrio nigripulchritudo MADA3029]|uniref:TRAP transporter large permease protein n=1 Tax=Vibrio nigripulchritudo TaxID=28173 RepID=U4K890_9VIBR|nr:MULTISPECIES: TRAP transporter large permease [Vibrio]KJY80127.1 C4-dicarboxylate ABC transporter permease [Vibrio nigripulchritudo]UAB69686.1 TRAP transporter large permease [Vibrio sp. SCSIO 43132]CCN46374.1 putative TRAP-type C4-dicarboxylate transport system, large permease component [Vibrio nigripulchritudo MADA3020]CCN53444.1 putative TRAP-type C4-dicarboxylate transport system, large permease component [Vibrio nigripulchritudo MADA3021]CCN58397.1 putative TRAP-type C4-dicarboxylate t